MARIPTSFNNKRERNEELFNIPTAEIKEEPELHLDDEYMCKNESTIISETNKRKTAKAEAEIEAVSYQTTDYTVNEEPDEQIDVGEHITEITSNSESPPTTPKKSAKIKTINSPTNKPCIPLRTSTRKRQPSFKNQYNEKITPSHSRRRDEKPQETTIACEKPTTPETEYETFLNTMDKRHFHNGVERQRRTWLNDLLQELKRQLPTVSNKKRLPKVNILKAAVIQCRQLNREHELYLALKKRKIQLLARVNKLRERLVQQRRFGNFNH